MKAFTKGRTVTEEKPNEKKKVKEVAIRAVTVLGCVAMCWSSIGLCATANSVVHDLVEQVMSMMQLVGVVVCVIGVAKFALAMKDENPDGQTRAVYYAIAGAILMGIKPIIQAIVTY